MSNKLLSELLFDNRFVRELPADPIADNYRRQVAGSCYSLVAPAHVRAPQLVCAATDVADLINLEHSELTSQHFVDIFSGNKLLDGMQPFAMCYGGHQFGNWAGQLGDGRAINLGEVKTDQGEHWTLQLKGAGPTPYSRTADGLAVLRSSVREFLCSEAMYHLGVPTTRALSLVLTGEQVRRDMFYDGNAQLEPGAIVCRVAQSFTRFGNFEIFSARNDIASLKALTDFTIRNDFAYLCEDLIAEEKTELTRDVYVQWFHEICCRTAHMIAHWMRVGFVHGVMNTDNMSILGLTIDYGPYGWLEGYDPDWTPNTTDAQGRRYRYINQSQIALWNLAQLGNAIYPLIEAVEPLQEGLNLYRTVYTEQWQKDMANKLGLQEFTEADINLLDELHKIFQLVETDVTIFYRQLANFDLQNTTYTDKDLLDLIAFAFYTEPSADAASAMANWLRAYGERLQQDYVLHGETNDQRSARMNAVNPKYVLRNYMAQQAIDKATAGDYTEVEKLLRLLRNPYDEQPEHEIYFAKRPEWARTKAGCSMLSCSS